MRHLLVLHGAFYALYALRLRGRPPSPAATEDAAVRSPAAAPHALSLLAVHAAAFLLLYAGLAHAALGRARMLFPPLPWLGGPLIAVGAAVLGWALVVFRSYRLTARLEAGHELCVRGPFRRVRHPIYAAFDLLALGTALWVPAPLVMAAAALALLAADLRAREEERLLRDAFGERYRDYCRTAARTIPGLY